MTKPEWLDVVREIRSRWPHSPIPDATIAVWFTDLEQLPVDLVRVGVRALYNEGAQFPPNGGLIAAKIAELDRDDPDHGEAWKLIRKANVKFGLHREHNQEEALEWLHEQSPAVAEAAYRYGPDSLGGYDLDDEGMIHAQFRDIYRAVLRERARDAAYAGLPAVKLRRLQRGPRKLGEVVKQIAQGQS